MNKRYLTCQHHKRSNTEKVRAARNTNAEMMSLYYSIGGYISDNAGKGTWETGAIEKISKRLREKLPGLR